MRPVATHLAPREVAQLRLAAQRLVGPPCETAAAAVRWMTATQAQDLPGALTSVALRTAGRRLADVTAALGEGSVVRSWPMRGTLHLVAGEDLGWMLDLTGPRLLAQAARRRAQLELDDATTARAGDLAEAALDGGRSLSRDELLRVWEAAGIATTGQRGYHLIAHHAERRLLCWGPVDPAAPARQQRLVLLREWVPDPRRPTRDEALGEWALRYLRSHGPATRADLARWAGLLAADVRTGLEVARPSLEALDVAGVEHWMDPRTPDRLAAAREEVSGVRLLPGFDEYLLGYADRTAALPAEHAEKVCPGRNGVFAPTVVDGGVVVGTWRRGTRRGSPPCEATPFTSFDRRVEAALPEVVAAFPA